MPFIVLWGFLIGISCHDIQVAFFKIHQNEDQLIVDFVLEKEDVVETLNNNDISLSEESLQAYLIDNFILSIDSKPQKLVFGKLITKEKHLYIQASLFQPVDSVKMISVNNTCLLSIDNHSNIIELRLKEQERDFLMNRERTAIDVEL